ncbi:MAG: heavy metal translocating P-type ATPase, partial [Clostridia bacterium]|nr:heavy metal translocating P-type ATPase [Clostridia bacterium]
MKIKLKKSQKKAAIRIAVSVLLLIGAVIADKLLFNMEERPPFPQYLFRILIYLPAYLACGHKTIISAFSGIIHGQWFDENFLMTLSSGCAIGLGECLEGCAVMILSCVGNLFESCAVSNARESLEELARLCPDSVKLCEDPSGSDYRVIPAKDAKIGDCFRVDAGDRIALDGTVIEGVSSVDCSSMTGEFLPVEVGPGSGVMSGTVNKDGKLIIRATKTAESSSAAKVVAMVESAGAKKTATESFITKIAIRYT